MDEMKTGGHTNVALLEDSISEPQKSSDIVAYKNENLKKSNYLIGAKFKATLLELRITYASLFMIQEGNYSYEGLQPVVKMRAGDLMRIIGCESRGVYKQLKPISVQMTNRVLGVESDERQEFHYLSFITNADYQDGVFTVTFNKDIEKVIKPENGRFTNLERSTMMSLDSSYSFRLYELLRQHCFYPSYYTGERTGIFEITKNLSELKMELGVINVNDVDYKKELSNGTTDYDGVVDKISKKNKIKSYDIWSNFKARCLDVAVKDINEKTDITVEYTPIRSGRGGKVHDIRFIVTLRDAKYDKARERLVANAPVEDEVKFQFYFGASEALGNIKLDFAEIANLGVACNYDLERLKKAGEVLDSQKGEVKNIVGFLLSAIKDEYEVPRKREAKKDDFHNFEEGEYDVEAMEKMVAGRRM